MENSSVCTENCRLSDLKIDVISNPDYVVGVSVIVYINKINNID